MWIRFGFKRPDPLYAIAATLNDFTDLLLELSEGVRIIMSDTSRLSTALDNLDAELNSATTDIMNAVRDLAERGSQDGTTPTDLEPFVRRVEDATTRLQNVTQEVAAADPSLGTAAPVDVQTGAVPAPAPGTDTTTESDTSNESESGASESGANEPTPDQTTGTGPTDNPNAGDTPPTEIA